MLHDVPGMPELPLSSGAPANVQQRLDAGILKLIGLHFSAQQVLQYQKKQVEQAGFVWNLDTFLLNYPGFPWLLALEAIPGGSSSSGSFLSTLLSTPEKSKLKHAWWNAVERLGAGPNTRPVALIPRLSGAQYTKPSSLLVVHLGAPIARSPGQSVLYASAGTVLGADLDGYLLCVETLPAFLSGVYWPDPV